MPLTFEKLHPHFAAEVGPIDLRRVHDPDTLAEIRAGMDEFAVLVFRDQPFADGEQIAFAKMLDGALHTRTGSAALGKSRLGNEALADISNLDENGEVMRGNDRRRMYSLGNRLWHTDASFQDPAGRYSMLSARVLPPVPADTEFADTRTAYDTLPAEMKVAARGTARPPLDHSLAPDPGVRVLQGGGGEAQGRDPPARPHAAALEPPVALRRLPRLADHRLARSRGAAPLARPDRARHPAGIRLPSRLASGRPRDLGQPRHDAPRPTVRRHEVSPRAPTGDDARYPGARPRRRLEPLTARCNQFDYRIDVRGLRPSLCAFALGG